VKLLAAVAGWLRARLLGPMPRFNHWLPPDDELEGLLLPRDTCFYCLTHKLEPSYQYPCPRRRAPRVDEVEA